VHRTIATASSAQPGRTSHRRRSPRSADGPCPRSSSASPRWSAARRCCSSLDGADPLGTDPTGPTEVESWDRASSDAGNLRSADLSGGAGLLAHAVVVRERGQPGQRSRKDSMSVTTSPHHLSLDERRAIGRAARARLPRQEAGDWDPDGRGHDALRTVLTQNAVRAPDLVPIRHGRMAASVTSMRPSRARSSGT
jgi:hypothetical protein